MQMELGFAVPQYIMPMPKKPYPVRVVGGWKDYERSVFAEVLGAEESFNSHPKMGFLNIVKSGSMGLPSQRICGSDDTWYFCVPSIGNGLDVKIRESFYWSVQAISNMGKSFPIEWAGKDEVIKSIVRGDEFAMDIETTDLDPKKGKIVSCGLYNMVDGSTFVACGDDAVSLLKILIKEKTRLVMCNSKFEQKWSIVHAGGVLNCSGDVAVYGALLNEEGHKGLDYLSMQVGMAGYDMPMTNFIEPLNTSGKRMGERKHHEAPLSLLKDYNALDCIATGLVAINQRQLLKKEPNNTGNNPDLLLRQCQVSLAMIELAGMKLDEKEVVSHMGSITKNVSGISRDLIMKARELGMTKFTPGFPADRVKLLNLCGIEVESSSKDDLNDCNDSDHPIVQKMLSFQKEKSLLSGLMVYCMDGVSGDGYLHSNFDCTSLVTGQLTSYDPPMLNIAKGPIRSMFTSRFGDKGVILELDYSQLHLRIMGNICKCANFIDAYTKGADIHSRTGAAAVLEIPEEEMLERLAKKDPRAEDARQLGKRTNFGIVTEITHHGLSRLLRIPTPKAERILKLFYLANPEIYKAQQDQHKFVCKHGYVVSPTGRVRHLPLALRGDFEEYERERVMRQATDYLISNPGRTTTIIAMVAMQRKIKSVGCQSVLINQIHDSLVHDIYLPEMDDFLKWAKECYINEPMKQLASIYDPIGLEMDGKMSTHWGGRKSTKFKL